MPRIITIAPGERLTLAGIPPIYRCPACTLLTDFYKELLGLSPSLFSKETRALFDAATDLSSVAKPLIADFRCRGCRRPVRVVIHDDPARTASGQYDARLVLELENGDVAPDADSSEAAAPAPEKRVYQRIQADSFFDIERIPNDFTAGYPKIDGLFFQCLECGDYVPSNPEDEMHCRCGNITYYYARWDAYTFNFGKHDRIELAKLKRRAK